MRISLDSISNVYSFRTTKKSPGSSYFKNYVSYPWTEVPEVKIKPTPSCNGFSITILFAGPFSYIFSKNYFSSYSSSSLLTLFLILSSLICYFSWKTPLNFNLPILIIFIFIKHWTKYSKYLQWNFWGVFRCMLIIYLFESLNVEVMIFIDIFFWWIF